MSPLTAWRTGLPDGFRTLEAAGALLGVSGPQLWRYENGERKIPADKVRAYAAITGIAPEILRPDVFGPPRPIKPKRAMPESTAAE
jgi:DNA-binding transcriptional regulator YdaS (Cro superfamily)